MKNKVNSFRYEIIIVSFLSLIYSLLTETILLGIILLVHSSFVQNSKLNMEESEKLQKVGNDLNYASNDGLPALRNMDVNIQSGYIILFAILAVIIGIFLFMWYFLLLTKKFSIYLKEIVSGIQEISLGNFEVNIPVKSNDEFSLIADSINHMAHEIDTLIQGERKNEESKQQLITSVAHDLRTPLTSIIGYLHILKHSETLEPEQRSKYIEIVYSKSKRLENLIEDLFKFTKYSSDDMKLHLAKIDLVKFMEQMLDEFYPSFQDNDLQLEYECPVEQVNVMADGNLLARAIGNLISNAIKYGKDGKVIRIGLHKFEDKVLVSVLNFGDVIPKEDLERIFERFYRVENSRSEETGGSGLGLAIAQSIIKSHGGEIQVSSDFNGTLFQVILNACGQ